MPLSKREQAILDELERQFTPASDVAPPPISRSVLNAWLGLLGLVLGMTPAALTGGRAESAALGEFLLTIGCLLLMGRSAAQIVGGARSRLRAKP